MKDLMNLENNLMESNEELIGKYLDYIDVSELTIKEYYSGLKNFFEYCSMKSIRKVTRQDIINYREDLKLEGKTSNTINLYLTAIKSFFKWLSFEGMYQDISQNIKSLPVEQTHTRQTLNIQEVRTILDSCKNDKEKLIISLAITTGIRANELVNIRIQDFVEKNGVICLYVLGKARQGMRTDFVVIPDNVFKLVQEYVVKYNITEYLFTSDSNNSKGKPLSTKSIRNIVNGIYERLGIKNDNLVFHSLRHSFASISIQNGNDIREVSQSLRHKGINTTMRYLHDLEMINNNCSNSVSNLLTF